MVRRPALLVCDALSSALDVETEQAVWDQVQGPPGAPDPRPTVLAGSHRRAALRPVDQLAVVQDGTVTVTGILDVMLATRAELRRLWTGVSDER
jgi:ABC-type multidrug transport system fused ATPase/permease subunit